MGRSVSDWIGVMLETNSVSLTELVEARISLEVPLAGLAAQHATPETDAELAAAVEAATGNDPASEVFRAADARFHRAIASAARNELLRAFTSWTLDVLQPSLIDTTVPRSTVVRSCASTGRSSVRSGCGSRLGRSGRCDVTSST